MELLRIPARSIAGAPNSPPWGDAGRRVGMGAAHLVAARPQAPEPVGNGPYDGACRRLPNPGARYVRALLSHRLRGEGGRLCRCLHGGDQLADRRARMWRASGLTGRRSGMAERSWTTQLGSGLRARQEINAQFGG